MITTTQEDPTAYRRSPRKWVQFYTYELSDGPAFTVPELRQQLAGLLAKTWPVFDEDERQPRIEALREVLGMAQAKPSRTAKVAASPDQGSLF